MCIMFSNSVSMCIMHNFLLGSLSSKTVPRFSMSQLVPVTPAICEVNAFMYYDMKCASFISAPLFIYDNTSQEMSEYSIKPFKRSV